MGMDGLERVRSISDVTLVAEQVLVVGGAAWRARAYLGLCPYTWLAKGEQGAQRQIYPHVLRSVRRDEFGFVRFVRSVGVKQHCKA